MCSKLIECIGLWWTGEEALAISIFCSLVYTKDFKSGILASINHSGDSDSTGSITGNILGLINGLEQIHEKWNHHLKYHEIVEEISTVLSIGCKSSAFNCDDEWWQRYPGY